MDKLVTTLVAFATFAVCSSKIALLITPATDVVAIGIVAFVPSEDSIVLAPVVPDMVKLVATLVTFAVFASISASSVLSILSSVTASSAIFAVVTFASSIFVVITASAAMVAATEPLPLAVTSPVNAVIVPALAVAPSATLRSVRTSALVIPAVNAGVPLLS